MGELTNRVVELLATGLSYAEVASKLDMSRNAVAGHAFRGRSEHRPYGPRGPRNPERDAAIMAMWRSDVPIADIAEAFGLTRNAISVISQRYRQPGESRVHQRGFAGMTPERRMELAKKGGASVPADKRSFSTNRELAETAGRKGGEASRGGGRPRIAEAA